MAKLQKELPSPPYPNLRFISFSVDPERDTPAVLKEYAAKFQADESRWRFITGPSDAMFAAAKGMLLTAIPANEANPIIHSTKFVLVDGEARIRQYYDYNDAEQMKALVKDAADLAAQESRPAPKR
jgi:protein SCO1/2